MLSIVHLSLVGYLINFIIQVQGHGRLVKPPSRSSVWRLGRFKHLHPPINYDDNQLFCGGVYQRSNPGYQCGICGDSLLEKEPRPNEIGGKYYRGIITEEYYSGDVINVEVEITAPHKGYMEWRLCTDPLWESQDCFNQQLLERNDGRGSRVYVGDEARNFSVWLDLPEDISCEHCVIQWNYRAGNNWGICANGEGKLGCGKQETFRGCSDIRIHPRMITPRFHYSHSRPNITDMDEDENDYLLNMV